jgi:uncharacterized protein YjbI with pentapeptide repeats
VSDVAPLGGYNWGMPLRLRLRERAGLRRWFRRYGAALAVAAAILVAAAFAWLLWRGAAWLDAPGLRGLTPVQRESAIDAIRGRQLQLGAGLVVTAGAVATGLTLRLNREGHITDRYTKAIDQLGSERLDVRLGAIYALERIMIDSTRDHPTIVEVLAAYVREHALLETDYGATAVGGDQLYWTLPEWTDRPATDVQAALTVLGRRPPGRAERRVLNLGRTRLGGADLIDANLTGATLTGANLHHAMLLRAKLTGAHLIGANLQRAKLKGADLTGAALLVADLSDAALPEADLSGADLDSAKLIGARLTNANLTGANLDGADLTGADLAGADLAGATLTNADLIGAKLTGANLTGARLDGADLTGAKLPAGSTVPGDDASRALCGSPQPRPPHTLGGLDPVPETVETCSRTAQRSRPGTGG